MSNQELHVYGPPQRDPKVRRPLSMPEQIANLISEAILSGACRPGDPLREHELSERFQVSRGPVREALRILETDGVVQITPNRGAHVTRLSVREIGDIFEIRAILVSTAMSSIAGNLSDTIAAAARASADRLAELAERPDGADQYVMMASALSVQLLREARNQRMVEMLLSLARQTARYARLGLATQDRRRRSAAHWRALVEALEAGEVECSAEVARVLIRESCDAAVRAIEAGAVA